MTTVRAGDRLGYRRADTDPVTAARAMGVAMRSELAEQVILHADHGGNTPQPSSRGSPAGTTWSARSVGRMAVYWGNAQAKSAWAPAKVDSYDRHLWPTRAAAEPTVSDWINRVYNRSTRHSATRIISPVDFEDQLSRSVQAARGQELR